MKGYVLPLANLGGTTQMIISTCVALPKVAKACEEGDIASQYLWQKNFTNVQNEPLNTSN